MAGKEIEYRVEVDAKGAERGFKQVGKAADRAGKDVAESFEDASDKAAKAIVEMAEKMDSELRSSITAADALAQALGPELTAKTDVDQVVADLNKMGLTFDEIRADADKFAAALKQVDDIRLQQVNDGLDTTRSKLGQVGDASDQSRSVLANLAGNAAQDLGALGGVVGSLGVGIGQLAEYAVDGNIALSNLAKVAGPLLGVSAALAAVGVVTANNAKKQEQYNKLQDAFSEALEETGDATEATNVALSESRDLFAGISKLGWEQGLMDRIPIVSGMVEDLTLSTEENIAAMAKAGITVEQWSQALNASDPERTAFIQSMKDMAAGGALTEAEFTSLSLLFADHRTTLENTTAAAEDWAKVTASSADTINAAWKKLQDPMKQLGDPLNENFQLWAALTRDIRDGTFDWENAADAIAQVAEATGLTNDEILALLKQQVDTELENEAAAAQANAEAMENMAAAAAEYNQTIRSQDWGAAALEGAANGAQQFFDQLFALDSIRSAREDAFDGLAESLKAATEEGIGFAEALADMDSPEARAVHSSLEQLAESLIPSLQDAYKDAKGDQDAFARSMSDLRVRVVQKLTKDLGLSADEAIALATELGLIPENVATQYQLFGDEEAKLKLELLQGVIDDLPKDVQAQIAYQISIGDWQGAVATAVAGAQAYTQDHPATIPIHADISAVIDAIRRAATIANATRIVLDVGGRAVAPSSASAVTPAAAGLHATRTVAVPAVISGPSVTIQAAVIGNRFDVERTVAKALRGYTRTGGRR